MRLFFSIIGLFVILNSGITNLANAQNYLPLSTGNDSDPSFYDIVKLSDNLFFAGGEKGRMLLLDSNKVVSAINLPDSLAFDILKILPLKKNLWISLRSGHLIKFSPEKEQISEIILPKFLHKHCIYDMVEANDSTLLLCGGSQNVAKGHIDIPNGFIASINLNTRHLEVLYKNKLSFVWSLKKHQNKYFAAAYQSHLSRTQILNLNLEGPISHFTTINALIHEIKASGSTLIFTGSKTLNYKKTGVICLIDSNQNKKRFEFSGGGIFDVIPWQNKIIGANFKGDVLCFDMTNHSIRITKTGNTAIYAIVPICPDKFYMAGHGNYIAKYTTGSSNANQSACKHAKRLSPKQQPIKHL